MPKIGTRFDAGEEPIDGYVLVEFLGRGQFGEVWKARDKASGKLVAIKIIDLTFSPTALKELRAFKLVKNLNHPNLVPIFTARLKNRRDKEVDFDKADLLPKGDLKELVIAMGLGEKSLSHRLKELNPDGTPAEGRRGLPVAELVRYMRGAAKGIDFLNLPDHGVGAGTGDGPIIHCDIKPENMMIVAGEVQIADCGVAVIISPDMRQTRAAGSPAYSAPELSGNKPVPGTDQYALAVSYYELRTGRLPFPDEAGLQQIILAHALGDLDFAHPDVSDAEREVIRRATARVPADRFETCEEFIEELATLPDIRAAIKSSRRPSSGQHHLPSRPSSDFDLPAGLRTPAGTGSGDLPPGRKSDVPAARQSDPARPGGPPKPPGARDSGPPPRTKPKSGIVDFDLPGGAPSESESVPRPSTPSWKDLDAGKPAPPAPPGAGAGLPAGTINFDLGGSPPFPAPAEPPETPAPTPWLPFPSPRTAPPAAEPPDADGPPPGLAATAIVPDLAPPPAPPAGPPDAGPAARDTTQPWAPGTETPATETPAAASGRVPTPPGGGLSGMPVDPDDPLGQRFAAAVPEGTIARIISEAQRAPGPTPPPPPAKPPKVKKAEPTRPKSAPVTAPPPPPTPDAEESKPGWFKEAVAEEAKRKSAPVPEKKKSAPVGPPPAPAEPPGWRGGRGTKPVGPKDQPESETRPSRGPGKIIAGLAVLSLVAAVVAGLVISPPWNQGGMAKKEDEKKGIPTQTDRGPPPPAFDEGAADKKLNEFLGAREFAKAEEFVRDAAGAPAAWRTRAQGDIETAKTIAAAPSPEDLEFDRELKSLAALTDLDQVAAKLKDALTKWRADAGRKQKLADQVVAKYDAQPGSKGRGKLAEVFREHYPYDKLTAAHRKAVAGWAAEDLRVELNDDPGKAFEKLAAAQPTDADVKAAVDAVGGWLGKVAAAGTAYGDAWPADTFKAGRPEVVRRWHAACVKPSDETFRAFKALATGRDAPPDPAAVAAEYFRLAGPAEPVADLRQVRDNARGPWKDGFAAGLVDKLDALFQGRLAGRVKAHLAEDPPKFGDIAAECGNDPANGWAAAAAVEAQLTKPGADAATIDSAATALKALPGGDGEFARYLSLLNGWVAGARRNYEEAATAIAAAYPGDAGDRVLGTPPRKARSAGILAEAAAGSAASVGNLPPTTLFPAATAGSDTGRITNWLRTAIRLDPTPDGYRHALLAAAAKSANDAPVLAAATAGLRYPLDRRLTPDQRITVCLAVVDPRAGGYRNEDLPAVAELARSGVDRIEQLLARSESDARREQIRSEMTVDLDKGVIAKGLAVGDEAGPARAALLLARGRLYAAYNSVKDLGPAPEPLGKLAAARKALDTAVRQAAGDKPLSAECQGWAGYARFLTFLYDPDLGKKPNERAAQDEWAAARGLGRAAVETDPGCRIGHQLLANMMHSELDPDHPLSQYLTAPETPEEERQKLFGGKDAWEWTYREYLDAAPLDRRCGNPSLSYNRASFCFVYANRQARGVGVNDQVTAVLTRGVDDLKLAADDGYRQPWLLHDLRGRLMEDRAWFARRPSGTDFAAAIAEVELALAAIPMTQPGRDQLRTEFNMDLGRLAYRAAVFGAGTDRDRWLGKAKQYLSEVTDGPAAAPTARTVQAAYFLALTSLARNDRETAEKAFVQAAAGRTVGLPYPVMALARLTLLHTSRAGADDGWKEKAAKTGDELQKLLAELGKSDDFDYLPDYLQAVTATAEKDYDKAADSFRKAVRTAETRAETVSASMTEYLYFDTLLRQAELHAQLHADAAARAAVRGLMSVAALRSRVKKLTEYRDRFPFYVEPAHRNRLDALARAVERLPR